jgi:TonB family protein
VFTNRYFLGALTFSLAMHLGLLATVTLVKKPMREVEFEEIHEVTFYDPSQRPEVAGVVGGGGGGGARTSGGGNRGSGGGGPQAYMPAIPGYKDLTDDQVAPLNVAARLSGTQVAVDVGKYAADEGAGLDVIRLADKGSGRSASTEDILAAAPLALARGVAGSGGGGGSGYAPYLPGGGSSPSQQPEELAAPTISQADLSKRIDRSRKTDVAQEQAPTQEKITTAPANRPSVTISGQISGRKRLRCGLPRYPDWAVKQGASGTVVIKLFVSADGSVCENMTVESTSGYPALDELVVNMLRSWQFASLDPGTPPDDQWGRITVRFVLG